MNCPFCGNPKTNVVFTGKPEDGKLQRRRFCPVCKKRFNTFERPFLGTPMVVKSDGKREVFDSEKLAHGIRIACAKRPVPAEKISELVDSIEKRLQMEGKYAWMTFMCCGKKSTICLGNKFNSEILVRDPEKKTMVAANCCRKTK